MVERAGVEARLGFPAHSHMLRHACGFALANKATIPERCRLTSATATSSTRCDIPSCRRAGSRTSGDRDKRPGHATQTPPDVRCAGREGASADLLNVPGMHSLPRRRRASGLAIRSCSSILIDGVMSSSPVRCAAAGPCPGPGRAGWRWPVCDWVAHRPDARWRQESAPPRLCKPGTMIGSALAVKPPTSCPVRR